MMNIRPLATPLRYARCKPSWAALLAVACLIHAPASAQHSIAAGGTDYTQDFDALTTGTWTDNSTLAGWYARTDATTSITTYGANTGATTTAGLYAFGIAGTNPLTDRALGYAPTNAYFGATGVGKGYLGWRLGNNTGSDITSLTVTWTGEQWRKDNANAQSLTLSYQQGATVADLVAGTWTSTGSTFASPNPGTGGALDGNAAGNRTAGITVNIAVNIPVGEEIMLRWEDLNDSGNDHLLAIDNVIVNATISGGGGCGITLGAPSATCNANTPGVDTYDLHIPYTGMDAGTSVVNNSASGTIAGDDPAVTSSGTIIISGITEGDAYNVTFTAPCESLTVSGVSPACLPPPVNYTLAAWETAGLAGNESSFAATTVDADATVASLVRGTGLTAAALGNAFSSTGFLNTGLAGAVSGNTYLQFSIAAHASHAVSLSSLHATFRRSGTGPNAFQWQYSTNGFATAGTNVGTQISYTGTATNGDPQAAIDLSAIPALQNVAASTTITFRLYGWGASATGGSFAIGRLAGDDLALEGSIANVGGGCGITLGVASTTCNANTPGVDTYDLHIPYTGVDAGTSVVNNSASGTIAGDDPAVTTDGTIIISGISEGDAYDVTFTSPCASLSVSGASPSCEPACGVTFQAATATCNSVTEGDADTYNVSIPYTGVQAGATVVYSGSGSVGGDDPASITDGTITISNIPETEGYSVSLSSPCASQVSSGSAPACDPGPLAAWDFTGENTVVTSTAEVYHSDLDASNLITRGTGATASAGANSFRTAGFQNNGIATGNTDYFEVTLSASPGYALSLSTIDARLNGTNTYAASPGVSQQFAYSLDGTNFTLIGSPTVTIGQPTTLPQIDLSGVAALQNVGPSTTVTLRYYASGQTGTGGWGFYSPSAGAYGLAIGGTLAPVAECGVNLGAPTATCNSITTGPGDTYDLEIPYTGVHAGVSVINSSGSGTVGGDDPALVENGTIVISGISEAHAFSISLSGVCNYVSVSGPAPVCEPPPTLPTLVINEVDYDQPGDDLAEFIELMNTGEEPVNLNGLKVVLVNGGNGQPYAPFITLGNVDLAPGDYYVIGSANVPNVDLVIFNSTLPLNANLAIQNGAPDGIRLTTADDIVIDQMSYEGDMSTTEGSSAPTDPGNAASVGLGLSRMPDGADTDDNSMDFVLTCLTPGEANGGADSDEDGTPDCIDLCPGGPEPGSPCDDHDDMTGEDTVDEECNCVGIPLDCEGVPGGPALPGEPCVDGDPGTLNDTWQLDCTCRGEVPDCLGELGGPNLPGAPCDDYDPSTNDEVWDVFCGCAGTPCSQNVVLDLRSDTHSDQISWEILYQNDGTVVCSGGGYQSGITEPIVEPCCLPIGCFRLRVMDSGGDGFVTGGYQLRESGANGRRIIDNLGNFTSGSVSALKNTYENGSFCVPIGDDKPIFSSCDKLDWVDNKFIVVAENTAVSAQYGVTNTTSGYEFWFFDPNGSYSFRRFRSHATSDGYGTGALRANHFKVNGWVNSVATPHIPANVLLNVRVRGRVAGSNLPFGPACQFKIDAALAACPRVKLQDDPANPDDYSCGVTRSFGGGSTPGNRITANPPQPIPVVSSSSVRYQFRFRLPGEGICIVRPAQTSARLVMNWAASTGAQLQAGKTYDVDVRVSLDGGATWCFGPATAGQTAACADTEDWGKVCKVTISSGQAQGGSSSSMAAQGDAGFTIYPNPNRGDQLFISLSSVEADVSTVSVDIFDLTGKKVTARTIAVADGFVKTNLELGGIANGMYMVHIAAGDKTYTERLVIQR